MAEIGSDITKAKKILDRGDLVAIPTETVYGLGGNALDPQAVTKIFQVKNRPFFDPLIVHIGVLEQLEQLSKEIPAAARQLSQAFWPGPLTIVLPKTNQIPDLLTAGLDTVAVRMPQHPLTLRLLKSLSYPLAAPSANPFGYISPTHPSHVQANLGKKIAYILDGGECSVGVESTIVSLVKGKAKILRPGGISSDQLKSIVTVDEDNDVERSDKVLAPGMLDSHYAPSKSLYLGDLSTLLIRYQQHPVGILSFRKKFKQVAPDRQIQLSAAGDLSEAAQNLFASLRKLDAMPISHILAEPVPDHGIGRAINDRLRRAAV